MSLSARALAASLSAAGCSVAAIDLFCDQDLCQIRNLDNYLKIPVFDTPNLLKAINRINEITPCNYLVYGGGIELCPDVLDQLPDNIILLGNRPATVQATNNPKTFFKLLNKLKIPYPETIFQLPKTKKGWLVKSAASCGGAGISIFDPDKQYSSSRYFQRFIHGRVCSVIFLAGGGNKQVVGFNEIWTENHRSFRFSGAITLPDFPVSLKIVIENYLQLLTENLELTGLCGMDFIIDDQNKIHILEINPRPTTTFELHDHNNDLLIQHVRVCKDRTLDTDREISTNHTCAKQVFYSEKKIRINKKIQWSEWVADQPHPAQIFQINDPVCTVYAYGKHACETKLLLSERILMVKNNLS